MAEPDPTDAHLPVAVGLVRCSTDMQEHSVQDQEAEIRAWCKEERHDLLQVFRSHILIAKSRSSRFARPHRGSAVTVCYQALNQPLWHPRHAIFLRRHSEGVWVAINNGRGKIAVGIVLVRVTTFDVYG